jgi:NADH-quinone oxidoreductase subunit M
MLCLYLLLFFFFCLSNLALPGTSSFVGELLILMSIVKQNIFLTFFATFSLIFGTAYSIWLFNRVCFGNLKTQYISIFIDITFREFSILFTLSIISLIMGFFPNLFLAYMHSSVAF